MDSLKRRGVYLFVEEPHTQQRHREDKTSFRSQRQDNQESQSIHKKWR